MRKRLVLTVLGGVMLVHLSLAQKPDRSMPPAAGPPPAFSVPDIQKFTLPNGLPVFLLEKHQVPLVQVNLLVQAGTAMDPAGKSGLANMTATMMTEGAGSRDALALADAIDYLGARITSTAGQHAMAVRLHTPVARLDSALALFADIALRPTFPAPELSRKKKERLTALLQWRDEARMLSMVTFNRTLYGDRHPYGVPVIGNERTLRGLTREDCALFHSTWFRPNYAALIVVGDVAPAEMRQKLGAAFGSWKSGTASAPALPSIVQVTGREVVLVDKPGAAQTEIRIGRIGVPRLTPDYYALVVMNTILGGSFTSRLNNNLREEHGYTYGASSTFDFRPLAGPFLAASAVQTAVTDSALVQFMKELRGIREPISKEEVERAKNYVALGYPADFQTVGQIAGQIEELVTYGLPDSYFNDFIHNILAVTAEDVVRVARATIDPDNIAVVLVGDRKVIEQPVKALGLGKIIFRTVDDVLGPPPALEEKKEK
jgi:predicted Zn-dependent peptidase